MTIHSVFFLFSTMTEGQFLKLSYVIQQMHQQTVSPCLSVCPTVFHSVHLSLSVSLSGWLAAFLLWAKGMKNPSFVADFSVFLSFVVFPASWNPFFRIPCEFLRGYSLSYWNLFVEITFIDANTSKRHRKSVVFGQFFHFSHICCLPSFSGPLFSRVHATL